MFKKNWFIGCLLVSLTYPTVTHASNSLAFQDISSSYAKEGIADLAHAGIINGKTDTLFSPKETIQRRHFAVLLAKSLGIQPLQPAKPSFVDVPNTNPEYGYIEALAELGILQGQSTAHMGATQGISREDAAVLIYRAFGKEAISSTLLHGYKDMNQISPYASEAVAYSSWKGLLKGNEGNYKPKQLLTREEAAIVTHRLYTLKISGSLDSQWEITPLSISLFPGESTQLELTRSERDIPVKPTIIFGFDQPAIGHLTPDGMFTALAPGNGLITVNMGTKTIDIPVSITLVAQEKEEK